jgi:hypothetical protein
MKESWSVWPEGGGASNETVVCREGWGGLTCHEGYLAGGRAIL